MNAKGISIACGALAAFTLGACSGDSQPTGPESGGTGLHYSQPLYSDVNGTPYEDPYGGGGSGTESPTTGEGSGTTMQYPLDQFLKAQGTFCADDGMGGCASYMGPTANYLGWFNRANSMSAAVDYAGIVSNWQMQNGRWTGTSFNGSVTETALSDGRARVVVQMTGDNVYAYITEGTTFDGRTLIGYSPAESYDRPADAVLGHLDMTVVYISPYPGAPMPDLVQMIKAPKDQQLESLRLTFEGMGRLRSTGERKVMRVEYDGSMGPIHPSHPYSSEPTTAMGPGRVQIVY